MKNWTKTRKIMAKIDRHEDVWVVLDRLNQAVRDIDGDMDELEDRVHGLEQEKVNFQTESGVHRIIKETVATEAFDWGRWAVRGTLGAAGFALLGWILKLAWQGFKAS